MLLHGGGAGDSGSSCRLGEVWLGTGCAEREGGGWVRMGVVLRAEWIERRRKRLSRRF